MSEKMFSISFDTELNQATNAIDNSVYLRVYSSMFTSGLVANMGIHNFATLLVIASYMNEKGECYPTQVQLAERLGVHKNSVNKYVNNLLAIRVNDKPVITREIVNQGRGRVSSFYKIQPLSQIAIFDGEVSNLVEKTEEPKEAPPEPVARLKTSEILALFREKYHETYGVQYNPAYGRDNMQLKKLTKTYTDEQIRKIIDIGVGEYDKRWKSAKFPRPSVGAISTWVANHVIEIAEQYKEQDKKFEESQAMEAVTDAALSNKLDKLTSL
ncbi:helix-turn-helix domain-containing protein [Bacillus nitratireducens]|uniref:helix-turn-helix domain-containing protein n=1 Tax=Bacillus nitratireducens TaxID=2026193 RepID=UPI00164297F6|nr:helix-turn-helix domain-containing protein [Bacillus nitratireducens]